MEAHVLKYTQIATATHEVVPMKQQKIKYMKTYVLKYIQIATATHEVVPKKQQKIRAEVYGNICTKTYKDSYFNT